MKSGLHGMGRLRRKLRRLPDIARNEAVRAVQDATNMAARAIVPEIPVDDGDLRDAYTVKLGRDKLSSRQGYTSKWKRPWKKGGWKSPFVLFGSKGGTVKSGPGAGNKIPPQPPNNFMNRGFQKVRPAMFNRIRTGVNDALKKAASL